MGGGSSKRQASQEKALVSCYQQDAQELMIQKPEERIVRLQPDIHERDTQQDENRRRLTGEILKSTDSLKEISRLISVAESQDVGALQEFLLASATASDAVQMALGKLVIPAGVPTSCQGYLQTISEAFPRPVHREGDLEREWMEMCREYQATEWDKCAGEWERYAADAQRPQTAYAAQRSGDAAPDNAEAIDVQRMDTIKNRIAAGWRKADAINYTLLSSVEARGPMAAALASKLTRFAASTYALMDALHSRVNVPTDLRPTTHTLSEDHSGRFYRNLTGVASLASDEKRWEALEVPDKTGFCGLTACFLTRPLRKEEHFDARGWKSQVSPGTYQDETCDIVAFDSAAKDEQGFHHGISVSNDETSQAFPPYTLFRLQGVFERGEWSAPGGLRPDCRLLLVTATYKFPDPPAA